MADIRPRTSVSIIDPTTDANEVGVDASGNMKVILAANGGVDIGDVTINGAPTGASAIEIQGPAAVDVGVVGDPLYAGSRANDNEPTAVSADGDMVPLWLDRKGRLVVAQGHPTPDAPDTLTKSTTGDAAIKAAPGAGQSIYVLLLVLTNTSSTAVRADVKDGTTVRFSVFLAADGGGAVIPIPAPGWKLTANTALNLDIGAAVTDVRVTAVTYVAP